MHTEQLDALSFKQRERLAYIDFRLCFLGCVRRQDLMDRFGIASAAATRDLALYRELFPANLYLDGRTKTYLTAQGFRPAFQHATDRVLSTLSLGFGDGVGGPDRGLITSDYPVPLNKPLIDVLGPVCRSIHLKKPAALVYYSVNSGSTRREIVPFALVDNGLRWHIRAFDRKSQEFRDFVLTRMSAVQVLEGFVAEHEKPEHDIQWNRVVELELIPHPDQPHPCVTEMDYGMTNGLLSLKLRAAVAGYVLRRWSVDCSPNHSLRGPEYRLWLKNPLALYGVANALLAPGYAPPPLHS